MEPAANVENAEDPNIPQYNAAEKYEKLFIIANGNFGEVYKARDKIHPEIVVTMKKVAMDYHGEGVPMNSLREVNILKNLKHENVINLIEVCHTKEYDGSVSGFYLVYEFCDYDLQSIISNTRVQFELNEIKQILQQTLNGLYFIHNNNVLHRDLKPGSILIDKNGTVKIGDFASARLTNIYEDGRPNNLTPMVVSLWYRSPELFLGDTNYGPAIDMWSLGLIMIEMFTRFPIMQGGTEQHQICYICKLCGTIRPEIWPNVVNLRLFRSIFLLQSESRKVRPSLAPYVQNSLALDLIDGLLVLDPAQRMTADGALNHEFFWTDPLPADLQGLLTRFYNNQSSSNSSVATASTSSYSL